MWIRLTSGVFVDPHSHRWRRRSIRLSGYDYRSDGVYFVTICTYHRSPLLGSIVHGTVRLSDIGRVVRSCWMEIPKHFPQVILDRFVVMPDHVHGLIVIQSGLLSAPLAPRFACAIRGSLATIVGAFKSSVTRMVIKAGGIRPVWQRNYYERVLRNDVALMSVRRYIDTNPQRPH